MKKKNVITIVSVIILAAIGMILGSQSQMTRGVLNFETEVNAQTSSQIPFHILYDQLFRLSVNFQKKAEEQRLKGESITTLKDYFKDEAKFSDSQNQIFEQLAIEYIQEVEPIDNQARQIISQIRQQFQDGWVNEGQEVPPPPTELGTLQGRRNSLALSYREKLQNLLGNDDFERFDSFVQNSFSQNFQAIGKNPQE